MAVMIRDAGVSLVANTSIGRRHSLSLVLALFAIVVMAGALSAPAEARQPAEGRGGPPPQGWQVQVGGAVVSGPFYPGGEDIRVLPVPYARVTLDRDAFSVSFPDGVRYALARTRRATFGIGANVAFGRDEEDDAILRGLGDVNAGFGPQIYGSYRLTRRISLNGEVFADIADGHEGVVARANIGYRVLGPGRQGLLMVSAGVEGGDENYASSFFGIDEAQAAGSAATGVGLPIYEAGAGLTEANVSAFYTRPVTRSVNLVVVGGLGQLVGDAADSPVVQDELQPRLITALAYTF